MRKFGFPAECSDGQDQCPDGSHIECLFDTCLDGHSDASHKEFMLATCPNGPTDASHKESLFARMSGCKSEDCGRRIFSIQMSGH
jgi:hypothetical protein